jgi:hypothetical protein
LTEKSSWDRQTDDKNLVWFGEIERKLAKLSMTPLLTVLPLNYFMGKIDYLNISPVDSEKVVPVKGHAPEF